MQTSYVTSTALLNVSNDLNFKFANETPDFLSVVLV